MSITIKRTGSALQVVDGSQLIPEGVEITLFTMEELQSITANRLDELDLQMPSFIRGDEDEDAEELFHL